MGLQDAPEWLQDFWMQDWTSYMTERPEKPSARQRQTIMDTAWRITRLWWLHEQSELSPGIQQKPQVAESLLATVDRELGRLMEDLALTVDGSEPPSVVTFLPQPGTELSRPMPGAPPAQKTLL